MPKKIKELTPPTGLNRLLFRLPIWLYRLGLGWLFGKRMLLLNHIGRKSGQTRKAVLEVVNHNPEDNSYVVCAGFGKTSQWYRNLKTTPDVSIQVGFRKTNVKAEELSSEEGGEVLLAFVKAHPSEAKFVKLLGYEVDGTEEDWRALGHELTFMKLKPR